MTQKYRLQLQCSVATLLILVLRWPIKSNDILLNVRLIRQKELNVQETEQEIKTFKKLKIDCLFRSFHLINVLLQTKTDKLNWIRMQSKFVYQRKRR